MPSKTAPLGACSYVYDTETGLYYLQSRYYDPEVGRFINADAFASTGQGILGNNMFSYCRNNPVSRVDIYGEADADCYDNDPLDEEDILKVAQGGGGSGSIYNESYKCYQANSQFDSSTANAERSFNLPEGKGFENFNQSKSYIGSAGKGCHWHNILEQCQIARSGFSPEQIHNTANVISVDQTTHGQITGYYNRKTLPFTGGLSVRDWLTGQPFAVQYDFGIGVLNQFGVIP